jgi:hypothetical protein
MVSAKKLFVIVSALVVLSVLLAAFSCLAEDKPTVTEKYVVTINDVGDGHVVDTITYSKDDYATLKKVQSKKRGFLTRRYTNEDTTGEIVDFKTDMKDQTRSVVITYEKPGMAYSTKGDFVLYAFDTKPKQGASGRTFTLEETSTVNSEFTLFTDQVFKTTSEITLPASARNAHYVSEDKALQYEMPAAKTLFGFWSDQKWLLAVIFGLLTVLFAALLVFVWTRKPVAAEASGAGAAAVPPPVQTVTPPVQQAQPPAPAQAETGHKFCKHCGSKTAAGRGFCTKCGTKIE